MKKTIALIFTVIFISLVAFGCTKKDEKISTENSVPDSSVNISNVESEEQSGTVSSSDSLTQTTTNNSSVSESISTTLTSAISDSTTNSGTEVTTTQNPTVTTTIQTTEEKETTTKNNEPQKEVFVVTFKDYDGTVLKTENVQKGKDATAPKNPSRDGFVFVKWDTYYKDVKTDIVVTAVYKKITKPTLVVDTVECIEKEAVVKVSVKNNPGLLAMLLKIEYDEGLVLKEVESGLLMKDYSFTAPKNLKSGCNAAWNIIEVPENTLDGDVALLHFEIISNTPKDKYSVSVSCYGGAFDRNYETVDFDVINGSIIN